jgi:DNA-binding NarL/FixJ family response regulator
MKGIKILVADDHPIFRLGLCNVIREAIKDCEIFEADNGSVASEIFKSKIPDVAILDINMPLKDGLELCKEINASKNPIPVILLTMFKEQTLLLKAKENGAKSYLIKDNSVFEVVDAIHAVLNHQYYWSDSLRELEHDIENAKKEIQKLESIFKELSTTELKTLKLVCKNYTSKEIADVLFVTPKSVDNYRSRICKKVGLDQGHNSLLIWAMKHKDIIEKL